MTTHTHDAEQVTSLTSDPGFQAFWSLRLGFAALPILFGIDKFALVLTDNWTRYLAPQINDLIPGKCPRRRCTLVGVIEIVAGLAVARAAALRRPAGRRLARRDHRQPADGRGDYYDVALRDFGLLLAALVLTRLAWAYPTGFRTLRS